MNLLHESLRRYTARVVDRLSAAGPGQLRRLVTEVLGGLGGRTGTDHVHLYSVSSRPDGIPRATLRAGWSTPGATARENGVSQVPLKLLFGSGAECLSAGQPFFAPLSEHGRSCSRLTTALLRETGTTGYLLCPVHPGGQFRGILGLAHRHGAAHIDAEMCVQIQLIGKLTIQQFRAARRETRQRRAHRQWKQIADAACDFALLVDEAREIRQVIRFGAAAAPAVGGLRLDDFVSQASRHMLGMAIERALRQSIPATCVVRAASAAGGERWYHARIEPPAVATGRWLSLFLTDDEAHQSQLEELRQLQEHLQRASRLSLLGQISTEFAHQVNQPLQAIMNFCSTLRDRAQTGRLSQRDAFATISNILDSVDHAAEILTRIREFATLRSLQLQSADLRDIIDRAVLMVGAKAAQLDAQLVVDPAAEIRRNPVAGSHQPLLVKVDTVQTTQVLINLLVNALEACAEAKTPKSRIVISVQPHSGSRRYLVCVSDNGPGLPPENPDIVFQKFHTTKREGLGIGLAVSRSVAEQQSGSLWAQNNSGPGCTFYFSVMRCEKGMSDTDEMETIT